MSNSHTVVLRNLVDLALGTPEVGAVNFNALHSLLHAMLSHLKMGDHKAIIPEEHHKLLSRKANAGDSESGFFSIRDDKSEVESIPSRPGTAESQPPAPYHALENRVFKLENQLNETYKLPDNKDLLERSASKKPQPIEDMWNFLHLSNKVDANEKGIKKLTSLVQDLSNDLADMKKEQLSMKHFLTKINPDEINRQMKQLDTQLNAIQDILNGLPSAEEWANFVTWDGLENALKGIKDKVAEMQEQNTLSVKKVDVVDRPVSAARSLPTSRPQSARSSRGPSSELQGMLETIGTLCGRVEMLEDQIDKAEQTMEGLENRKADKEDLKKLNIAGDLLDQLSKLRDQLEKLRQETTDNNNSNAQLQKDLLNLRKEISKLESKTNDLDKTSLEHDLDIQKLKDSVEMLQKLKADKLHIEGLLSTKADRDSVDGKLDKEIFEANLEELHKLISDLLTKLLGSEDAWKTAYDKMALGLDDKLDKMELDAIKEYLAKKLRELEKKIAKAAPAEVPAMEDQAAALRKQLLFFNCLSCDRPLRVLHPKDPVASLGEPGAFPAHYSSRPYQIYDINKIRKYIQRINSGSTPDTYRVSRSAGGPHTLTYSHQRLQRMMDQPEFADFERPRSCMHGREVMVQGVDGNIYKARCEVPSKGEREIAVSKYINHLNRSNQSSVSRTPLRPKSARIVPGSVERPTTAMRPKSAKERTIRFETSPPSPVNQTDDQEMSWDQSNSVPNEENDARTE